LHRCFSASFETPQAKLQFHHPPFGQLFLQLRVGNVDKGLPIDIIQETENCFFEGGILQRSLFEF